MRRLIITTAPNAVLHPWLQAELTEVLATRPPITCPEDERPPLARWATWLGHEPRDPACPTFCDACFTGDYPTSLTDLAKREHRDAQLPFDKVA